MSLWTALRWTSSGALAHRRKGDLSGPASGIGSSTSVLNVSGVTVEWTVTFGGSGGGGRRNKMKERIEGKP